MHKGAVEQDAAQGEAAGDSDLSGSAPASGRSVVFRALVILLASVAVTSVTSIAVLSFYERMRLDRELVENGHVLLANLVENTWDSISMGQRATFQRVIDDFAQINGVKAVAMYSRFGLMNYRSGEKTVGKPFVRSQEGLKNPNLEPYRRTNGRHRRDDWDIRDADEAPEARRHAEEKRAEGKTCGQCHYAIDESLRFDEEGRAHVTGDDLSQFFYRIEVEDECVLCHTNWKPGETASYLQVTLDKRFFNQEETGNLLAMTGIVFAVLLPALGIMLSVFRGQARLLNRRVQERTAALNAAHERALEANARLRELDELKSGFLSSVSHELRTPLTSVIGFAKLTGKDFRKAFLPLVEGDKKLSRKGKRIAGNMEIIVEPVDEERLFGTIDSLLENRGVDLGGCIVVRNDRGAAATPPVVPAGEPEVVDADEMWRRLDAGYRETIVLLHGTLHDNELERLAHYRQVQVVIAPERGSEAESGETPQ